MNNPQRYGPRSTRTGAYRLRGARGSEHEVGDNPAGGCQFGMVCSW